MKYDFVIIGAGIIGLTLARQLMITYPTAKICIIEKEAELGMHASGRNSGVLHSGIYYPSNSLKSKLCLSGFEKLKQYCLANNLNLNQCGKVVVCANEQDEQSLNAIYDRALDNNVKIEKINKQQLKELEPNAYSAIDAALWVPGTSVFDPKSILNNLASELTNNNIDIKYLHNITDINRQNSFIKTKNNTIYYGHLFNTAGLFADQIAKQFDLCQYSIMPFKGLYYYLEDKPELNIQRLIYPAPDINLPFLGIHITKNINNQITVGPSAFPALGRENYQGFKNINIKEIFKIAPLLLHQYWLNHNNFRNFTHHEIKNFYSKSSFYQQAKKIYPILNNSNITKKIKVGIRAQLLDLKQKKLVMDLLIENTGNSTHILNAVSPAFTCSFAMAEHIVNTL